MNTDAYPGVDLEVTVGVTATIRESGTGVALVPEAIIIPPQQFALVGPFGREHEDVDQKVNLTFEGEEGSYVQFELR